MENDIDRVHAYIGQLINATGCQSLIVGGVKDHIHALLVLSSSETVSHLIEEIKRNSSRWIKTLSPRYSPFAWQSGYAAFSVSQSIVEKTSEYIKNQKTHHQNKSFEDEYIGFMNLYQIKYNERYVFSD